jgi:hypothetical protein
MADFLDSEKKKKLVLLLKKMKINEKTSRKKANWSLGFLSLSVLCYLLFKYPRLQIVHW